MSDIPQRIQAIRAAMAPHGVSAYLVPSSDEHLNEYLPLWRTRRQFLSGFTGSAGDLLITDKDVCLFADGRYHLQAEEEVRGTEITVMKVGSRNSRALAQDLEFRAAQQPGFVLGVDPSVIPLAQAEMFQERLLRHGARLMEIHGNLVDPIWTHRTEPSRSPLLELPADWCGSSVTEKLATLRTDLDEAKADSIVVLKLDQIAWLLNLRSKDDVPYNPVFEAYLHLGASALHLFLRGGTQRLAKASFADIPGVHVHEYDAFHEYLSSIRGRVLLDPSGITLGVASALRASGATIVTGSSPLEERKAVKNPAEQDAQRRANLRASVAKTKALLWLRREIRAGHKLTEEGFRTKIESLYADQPDYFGLSFNTIAATGSHGAIIHYGACDATPLEHGHLFLIDSGTHIGGGTTDDTRTVAVGSCDEESRRVYTLVLKGHIAAARQHFPQGTPGTALDALARSPLWNGGLSYDHGTGHGVGAFLNVHEGPFSLSERERKSYAVHPLKEGIVSSIEPGYYRTGWGGVRIENLYLYVRDEALSNGRVWLRLEPLTWIPMDCDLIDRSLLDPPELAWLDRYHDDCVEKLSPHLEANERRELMEWLRL